MLASHKIIIQIIYVLLNFTSSLIVLCYSTCETIIAEISLPHGSDYDTFIWSTFDDFLQHTFHFSTT